MKLKNLVSIPKKSIYCFVNRNDKKIAIFFSRNTLASLSRNMEKFVQNLNIETTEFEIIETINHDNDLRVRFDYWCAKYRNEGWEVLNQFRAVHYKALIEARVNLLSGDISKAYAVVLLRSRGYKEIIVGLFDSVSDAKKFLKKKYRRNIVSIIYADNEYTKHFREENG